MTDTTMKAAVELSLIDRLLAPLRAIIRQFDNVTRAAKAASAAFALSANLKQSADAVKGFADDLAGIVKKPIDTFISFEEEMSKVRANTFNGVLTAETRKEFEQLSATARQLGADTQFSGMQAAQGMTILATQGFAAKQQIAAMPGILNVAAASAESIASAADIGTAAMTQFGLKAGDMDRIGDVLIKTANSSATGLIDIGEALKYVGSSAGAAGVSLEETTAMVGALGNAGVKGSMAGTALRAMLSGLQAPTKIGKSALQLLGVNPKDKSGNLKPLEDLLAEMDRAMDKRFGVGKGGVKRAALLKAIFGEEAAASAGILTRAAGSGELEKLIESNRSAAGTAAAVAKDMSNNTAGAKKELDSAIEEMNLTVAEVLIPTLADLVKGTRELVVEWTAWAKENPELVKTIGLVVGGLAGIGMVAAPVLRGAAAVLAVGDAVKKTAIYMRTHPILAIISAIAFAAYLIYDNWEPISAFFQKHWKAIMIAVGVFMPVLLPIIGAAKLIYDNWEPIRAFFINLWNDITEAFTSAINWIMDKIGWVGEQVEAFSISVMSPTEAVAYAAQKAANAKEAGKAAGLFADDLVGDPNSGTRSGVSRFEDTRAAGEMASNAVRDMRQAWTSLAPVESDTARQQREAVEAAWSNLQNETLQPAGPAMKIGTKDQPIAWDPATGKATGELKITVVDGAVAKTETRTDKGSWWTPKVATGRQ
jgi:TP901 family phage tail tape measure protein